MTVPAFTVPAAFRPTGAPLLELVELVELLVLLEEAPPDPPVTRR